MSPLLETVFAPSGFFTLRVARRHPSARSHSLRQRVGRSLARVPLFVLLASCGGGGGPPSYSVGGAVSGLAGSGLVLRDNGADDLTVSGDGTFTFPTPIGNGQSYSVTVATEPSNPLQTCNIRNGMGRSSGAAITTVAVDCVTPRLAMLAGNMGGSGTADGPAVMARFSNAFGIATDSAGNVYLADTVNQTVRKITPGGVVSTLAGATGSAGSADGTGAAAHFYYPNGIATDNTGNVYVADTYNSTVRKIAPDGVVSTLAGTPGNNGSADGTGAAASFHSPEGIATDSAGNVYVADTFNHTVRKITPDGVVSTLAGVAGSIGSADGTGAAASFHSPEGIATDSAGNVYVADSNCTVRKVTPGGVVSTLAGVGYPGSADGIGAAASFHSPRGIATDSAGNVYVADLYNSTVRKITPDGVVSTVAGVAGSPGSTDGTGAAARFNWPGGVATDSTSNIYVADTFNHSVRKIAPDGVVTTLAGAPESTGSADGIGTAASFNSPEGITTDGASNVYVADTFNHTVRKIAPGGVVSTLAGVAGSPGSTDGTGATARFGYPLGIATDSAGSVYVTDTTTDTIRKITPGGAVMTLAGSPLSCSDLILGCGCESQDGVGTAAGFCDPEGIATDSAGNVYVADTWNDTVRKITPGGVVSTLAGMAGNPGSANGTGAEAKFGSPHGIAIDSAGSLYVADTFNSTVRKITPAGVVTTVVGIPGQAGFEPGELPALLGFPVGVAISGTSLYITLYNGVAIVQSIAADR